MSTARIASSRRSVQTALVLFVLLFPFLSINGNPALRMDIGQRTFFLAGAAVRIDQFYLVLLLTLVMVAGFLLLTLVLGRVWCGWVCPQTVLNDALELAEESIGKRLPAALFRSFSSLAAVLISLLVSYNLLCWFMAPDVALRSLFSFSAHPVITSSFIITTALMYLNLTLVKRSFCHSYCPYGRFQAALLDEGTLNLAFIEETRDHCINCRSCVKVCPMGIDIRNGFQIECINCGRCIDACRGVMQRLRKDVNGLIGYRFGVLSGGSPKIGTKTLILALLLSLLTGVLAWGLSVRSDAALSVQRIATSEPRVLVDGTRVQAWKAFIGNRSQKPVHFALEIVPPPGGKLTLIGPVSQIRVAANENCQIGFFISRKDASTSQLPAELRLTQEGNVKAAVNIVVP